MELVETSMESNHPQPKILTTTGKVLLYTTGGIAVSLTAICLPFVSPALRKVCLPYIPATDIQLQNILIALQGCRGSLIDIGSGDGRIVIEAAKKGFQSFGVEMNPWLVIFSRANSFRNNVFRNTKFFKQDLWKHNLKTYENVVIFGVESMMEQFERKLLAESNNGTVVIACRFPLPGLKPIETIGGGVDTVWKYEIIKS